MTDPFLSIIIPAYNEAARIGPALRQALDFLDSRPYSWELLVADDGSSDATARLAAEAAAGRPNLRILSLPHRGKGWAVKNAMLAARGEYRLLCDADLPVPVAQIERLIPPSSGDVDVAVGSRAAPGATRTGEPWVRRVMGRAYNALVRLLAPPRPGRHPMRLQVLPRPGCAPTIPAPDPRRLCLRRRGPVPRPPPGPHRP